MSSYRLSLDIGTNSIGWCALELDTQSGEPVSVAAMGVRIFPDGRNPKDGSSNAVARRKARGMRRNRDRFVERRTRLLEELVKHGLMPEDPRERRALTALDPYELRARGIREKLPLHELGRAIFHLNQRRGFKSNHKSDSKADDTGAIKTAIKEQQKLMDAAGADSFGHFLYLRREAGQPVLSRLHERRVVNERGKEKKEDYYEFYPSRDLISHEFDMLWRTQEKFHPDALTKEARDSLRHIIFYQRPLKEPPVGKCTFERSEDRAPKALPIVQRLRVLQELNHLFIIDQRTFKGTPLTVNQRDQLLNMLTQPKGKKAGKFEVTFDAMRKRLGIGDARFSLESEKRQNLEGDTVAALLAHKDRFGPRWFDLPEDQHEEIVRALLDIDDEEALIQLFMERWKLGRAHAEAAATTPLPDGHSRLGVTASRKIAAALEKEVIPYSEAVTKAGYLSHSQFAKGEKRERLPYYAEVLERHVVPNPEWHGHPAAPLEKRFGKVTNPTVHIALNQVRQVVNDIIKLHGAPDEIHVEVLRELKQSLAQKKEMEAEQKKNQDENEECARLLREKFKKPVNRENIQRVRLWREIADVSHRVCPYTGESISCGNLFSAAVEIDHILPFSKTLDDGMANKVLCMRHANREKGDRAPFDAWGNTAKWPGILDRSALLRDNKRWRFAEDAMQRYLKDRDFLARQLTDSQYIARLAREYLAVLFDPADEYKVVCLPGRLTGLFRKYLGLGKILDEINPARRESAATDGEKNRNDHRHHALDALVIGLMDRSFLQRAASIHARPKKEGGYKLFEKFPEPWPNFRPSVREALERIVVSHKRDHSIEGVLHNDTAYGVAKRPDSRGNAVHRIPVSGIKTTNILSIKGKFLRARLVAHLAGMTHEAAFKKLQELDDTTKANPLLEELCGGDAKDIEARAKAFLEQNGIRRMRLIENVQLRFPRKQGPFKGFATDGNAYLDIFQVGDDPRWNENLVTRFDANAKSDAKPADEPPRKRVMRLFNRDMLEAEQGGVRKLFYIQKMSSGMIAMAEHFEANADSRNRDKEDPFKFVYKSVESLRRSNARFLIVTPAGRVRYLSDAPDDSESG